MGTSEFPADAGGYQKLLGWLESQGTVVCVGVEGTGSYGAGLARHLDAAGIGVVEVNRRGFRCAGAGAKLTPSTPRPQPAPRSTAMPQRKPKAAARAAEAIRMLQSTRRSAVKARTQAANQIHALLVTAPDIVRDRAKGLRTAQIVEVCARMRPDSATCPVEAAAKTALRALARRHRSLDQEIAQLDEELLNLCEQANPALLAARGVGADTAAVLLVAAGDNPERMRTEAAFAALCRTHPIQASSGKTIRHRLNRNANRQANTQTKQPA